MLKIAAVTAGSPADELGLRPGDQIARINGEPVRDLLDFHFMIADEDVKIEFLRDLTSRTIEAVAPAGTDLGLSFEPEKVRLCGNECVFCFIDQNPGGMRKTIYVKDEDYRLSFLHGSFTTLTNMKTWELERIVRQRLSPQYISVHSTDPETRRRLLKPKFERDVMEAMRYLTDNGIVLHTQIVLCPGYNDGDDLVRTIEDLAAFRPKIASLAVVPLGTTDHRQGLPDLAPVTPEVARHTLQTVGRYQRRYRSETGITWVYLADEFYRMLGRPVPPADHYDGFPQLENGIGMTRHFLRALDVAENLFGEATARGERVFTIVTGEMFAPILRQALARALKRTGEDVEVRVAAVSNDFFGRGVTVAGLLAGSDIRRGLETARGRWGGLGDRVFLPPATVSDDGVFLDDLRPADLEHEIGVAVEPRAFAPSRPLDIYEGEGAHELSFTG